MKLVLLLSVFSSFAFADDRVEQALKSMNKAEAILELKRLRVPVIKQEFCILVSSASAVSKVVFKDDMNRVVYQELETMPDGSQNIRIVGSNAKTSQSGIQSFTEVKVSDLVSNYDSEVLSANCQN